MKCQVKIIANQLRATATVALALLLACWGFLAVAPAQKAYAAEAKSLPAYTTWTLQGSRILMWDPSGNNSPSYTPGTSVSVSTTGYSSTSVSQSVSARESNDSKNSFSFSESWSWSELPSTVAVGKEDSIRVTGSISVGAASSGSPRPPRATFKMRFYLYAIDQNPENSNDKFGPVESKDIEALSPFYEHGVVVDESKGKTDFNVGNSVNTIYNWVDANGGGSKGYAGDVTSFGSKASFTAVPPADALVITKKLAQKGTHGVLAESAGAKYLMLVTIQCQEAGYAGLYYYTTGGKEAATPAAPAAPTTPNNTVVETQADKTSGESDGIPLGPIVGGLLVIIGGTVIAKGGKKGEDPEPPDSGRNEKQEEQPQSTFQLITWKDFGDTLMVDVPQMVGARIEEITPEGQRVDRPDLTALISIQGSNNITVGPAAMSGNRMVAQAQAVEVEGKAAYDGVVSFIFTGLGGSLTNRMTFHIANAQLVFAEENLTFIAGQGQTQAMPFGITGLDASKAQQLQFQAEVITQPSRFVGAHVEQDPDFPSLWNVVLTEDGTESKLPAGTMEDFTCEVRVLMPGASKPLVGSFTFYRFHEGLLFSVQHLKAFYTVKESQYNKSDVDGFGVQAAFAALGAASGMGAAGLGGAATARVVGLGMGLDEYEAEVAVLPADPKNPLVSLGRASATVALYTWDEEQGAVLNPVPPIDVEVKPGIAPAAGCVTFAFEDIAGSSVLKDKDGKDIQRPCETLQFFAFPTKLQTDPNVAVFSIIPTKGLLMPPNRSQAKVTVTCEYNGKTYSATETVNVLSQPYRQDLDLHFNEYEQRDAHIMERLSYIQKKIVTSEAVVERSLDGERLVVRDTYGDMMPVFHRIDAMMDGYSVEFGFYEPDYQHIEALFQAYTTGQIGTTAAAECAFYGRTIEDSDALLMTVSDFNHSWWTIGARIGFAVATEGTSEGLFIAIQAEMSGFEAMMKSIDKDPGDKMLEHFRVGCSEAAKTALADIALGKIVEGGLGVGLRCAKALTKTASAAKTALAQKLAKSFSTAAGGAKIGNAAKAVAGQTDDAARAAKELIARFGNAEAGAAATQRDIAYTLGRIEGRLKVERLAEAMKDWGKLSRYEQRGLVMAIQQDKHAMRALMEMEGEAAMKLRAQFSAIMTDLEAKGLHMARVSMADDLGISLDKIRVKKTSGNLADDVISGKKVSMDMDATFEVLVDGKWVDIKDVYGQAHFDRAMYKVVYGYEAADDAAAAAFGKLSDFSIVDAKSLESYGTYRDAMIVINKSRAGEVFDNAAQVGKTAEYKCEHWLGLSKSAMKDAEAALTKSNALYAAAKTPAEHELAAQAMREAQALFAASEAFAEEGSRQFIKQFDRIVVNKVGVLQKMGVQVDLKSFGKAAEVIRQMGLGKNGGTGLTTVQVETILSKGLGTDLQTVFHELNVQTVQLNNLLQQAAK